MGFFDFFKKKASAEQHAAPAGGYQAVDDRLESTETEVAHEEMGDAREEAGEAVEAGDMVDGGGDTDGTE